MEPDVDRSCCMDTDDLFASLERHLRSRDDIEMILLKGHLILEQALNQMLLCYIESQEDLCSLNLMFSKKLDLLVALSSKAWPPEEIDHLREINRIRNKLAHQLDFDAFHGELKRWACQVVGYTPKSINRKQTYRSTLMKAFYLLSGLLLGMAKGRKEALRERSNQS